VSRRVSAALLAAALALPLGARAGKPAKPNATPPEATALLARDYRLVPTLADLPESVQRALAAYLANAPVADPGQPWDATKPATKQAAKSLLPSHRLRLMGYTDGAAFVAYEHGGRKRHDHLVLMSVKDGGLALTWTCHIDARGPLDLPKLRSLAKTGCEPAGASRETD
jgi:hypothetical protein